MAMPMAGPMAPAGPAHPTDGSKIGPNAILQTVAVMVARHGPQVAQRVLRQATGRTLEQLPEAMVDEAEVHRLMQAVVAFFPEVEARALLWESGRRTGDYLLAHRIPKPVQFVLEVLPPAPAMALLDRAMAAHAWTFAGSGRFTHRAFGGAPELAVTGCPLCGGKPWMHAACAFYGGTFERLLQVLVHPAAQVVEVECEARGGRRCRFEVRGWETAPVSWRTPGIVEA